MTKNDPYLHFDQLKSNDESRRGDFGESSNRFNKK